MPLFKILGHIQSTSSSAVAAGSIFVLIGSFLHALMFTLAETILSTQSNLDISTTRTSPILLSCFMGAVESGILLIYDVVIMIMWGPEHMILHSLKSHHTSILVAVSLFFGLVALNATHAFSFFHLLPNDFYCHSGVS